VAGKIGKEMREFEAPTFHPNKSGKMNVKGITKFKRIKVKSNAGRMSGKVQA
jgi:hypothetical protein